MIITGIDVGNITTKAVIIDDGRILSWVVLNTRGDINKLAELAVSKAADEAGLNRDSIQRIISTGAGRKEVRFADTDFTEITCDAQGANRLFPSIDTIIDIGAEECRVLTTDGKGHVVDFFINDKCAAGVGMFIEVMAKALGVPLEEAGPLSLKSSKQLPLSTSCVVFAESEIISLINSGENKADVLQAIHMAAAMKTYALLIRLKKASEIALLGGVALNTGFINCLGEVLDADLRIPENPRIVGALGAALLAQRK